MKPQTSAEQIVALGREVFGCEIREQDDFFAIGGDSLNAVEFLTRLEGLLGKEVELRLLWEAVTIHEFANALADAD